MDEDAELFARVRLFEWDEGKRLINLREHGFDFNEIRGVFDDAISIRRSDREGETRFLVYGFLNDQEVAVICTFRGEHCRIISARRARKDERRKYHSRLSRRSGPGQN